MNKILFTYEDLIRLLQHENPIFKGNKKVEIVEFKSIRDAGEHSISFIGEERNDKIKLAQKSNVGCVLIDYNFINELEELNPLTLYIAVESPRAAFVLLLSGTVERSWSGIHKTAVIHSEAIIGENVSIGANCVIGKSIIKNETVIHPNVTILDNVSIGSNVIIWSGSVIGADGFGYLRTENGIVNFPHIGGVIIEDDVHIGSNTCIDKGALGNTFIGRGVKVDNLVHIAHNVTIGENTFVIANTMIGGSTRVGNNSWIAPSSSLRDTINIGNNTTIGMGSVVTKNVKEDSIMAGSPARPIDEFIKINNVIKDFIKP
jgi:UDP-3-O-[3-hydroxymyristoyl] glucosamine N-acyltransferase